MRLAKIHWNDAYSLPDDWHELPLEPVGDRPMVTVGWVVQETEWAYAIAHTYDSEENGCCGVIVLPKSMITEVIILA